MRRPVRCWPPEAAMASIEVDGRRYPVTPGDNLLKACLELGLDLPYF